METATLFPEYVGDYMKTAAQQIEWEVNGTPESEAITRYYHKEWLSLKFSPDFKYSSKFGNNSRVKADYVSPDSPLPLKRRGSLGGVFGDISKSGSASHLNETQVANLQTMQFRGATDAEIASQLYDDFRARVYGIYDNNEYAFLKLLSDEAFEATPNDNTGALIRVEAGYLPENKFTASIKWGEKGYKPITDIKNVRRNAKGIKPAYVIMSDTTYELIRLSDEAKLLYAQQGGIAYTSADQLLSPNEDVFNSSFKRETKLTIVVVEQQITFEKNGEQTAENPFSDSVCIFSDTLNLGGLYYTPVPESRRNTSAVLNEATTVDTYIWAKKWGSTNPQKEWTAAEAYCMPVIEAINNKYVLRVDGASDDEQTEGDSQFTVDGVTYNKSHFIAEMANVGNPVASTISDAALLATYNTLSTQKKNKIKGAFPTVAPDSLSFTKAADSTGKKFEIGGEGTVTASSSVAFATATVSGSEVTITVTANSGVARTSDITITRGGRSVISVVTQAGV